jgi:hypothetical protein
MMKRDGSRKIQPHSLWPVLNPGKGRDDGSVTGSTVELLAKSNGEAGIGHQIPLIFRKN